MIFCLYINRQTDLYTGCSHSLPDKMCITTKPARYFFQISNNSLSYNPPHSPSPFQS
ncbi:hypothetical protein NEIMUCOT_04376 [Neisseria mucosa ATCC 25996]|uniref:Uncharacterized protein n=1 Tax=Neisseria mucosa (strain ATCC 25996 / DSM 4631 / NCTC 10774 / M26) TaxID=546266 RepID=D2ZUT6_NEIM2|nr:hypothetical protein NEIMUCOT_04376 [Neisseria mucosa ATCC 25996]